MSANLEAPQTLAPLPYVAETPLGAVQLVLPAATDAFVDDSAAIAAVRLASVEELLQSLDDWLSANTGPLDWQWPQRPAQTGGACVALRSIGAEVSLPWQLLRRAGPAPENLHSRMEWPLVEASLLLDRFDLDDDDVTALEPGGVVLLSLDPEHTSVRATDGLDAPAHPASPEGTWSVTCPLARPCPLPEALGWKAFDRRPALARPAQLWHGSRLHATGELIPWGSSQAFRLHTLTPR